MADRLISCDDHLDLGQLPADLWTTRLSQVFRDRAPHIEEREGAAVWICDGKVWGSWAGKRRDPSVPRPKKPFFNAFDRAGLPEIGDRRPAVAELRLADMDRDGVATQVIFGPIFSISTDDPVLRVETRIAGGRRERVVAIGAGLRRRPRIDADLERRNGIDRRREPIRHLVLEDHAAD